MELRQAMALGVAVLLALPGCSEEEATKSGEVRRSPGVTHVSACSLLKASDVAGAIAAESVTSAPERTMGGDAGQAFISTCVWATPAAEAEGGQRSVTLTVWSWPEGTGSAQSFIQGFRDTARMKSLPPPEELLLGDEAVLTSEGLQARKGDITLSVSAAEKDEAKKAAERQLAEKALAALKT